LQTARPAVYHSRVFTAPQSNYPVHEQELLALEDLIKSYEHWLIGRPFIAVTDSQAMLSLLKQKHLSPRQWQSVIYLSKFDITFEFIEGKKNIIADLLSRIAERSTYKKDLPYVEESDAHHAAIQLWHGKTLLEEPQITKRSKKRSETPSQGPSSSLISDSSNESDQEPSSVITPTSTDVADAISDLETFDPETSEPEYEITDVITESPTTPELDVTKFSIAHYIQPIIDGYNEDAQFKMAYKGGIESGIYVLKQGLLYTGPDKEQLCIPDIKVKGGRDDGNKSLREMLIAHAHEIVGHHGEFPTQYGLRKLFYWKTMSSHVHKYVRSYHSCQTRKTAATKQYGKNHPLPIPKLPWQIIAMDFLINLPSSMLNDHKYNSLYGVVDILTKMVHLIPTTTNVKAEGVAKLYFENIYRLHGLPKGIVSDRDTKFTGAFWRTLQKMIGTDLLMSTTAHPQTDGQSECTNRTLLQIL